MPIQRVIWLVLDSFGIGSSSDAEAFGDAGANTLGHIAQYSQKQGKALHLPHMASLGLLHAYQTSTSSFPAGMHPPLDRQPRLRQGNFFWQRHTQWPLGNGWCPSTMGLGILPR